MQVLRVLGVQYSMGYYRYGTLVPNRYMSILNMARNGSSRKKSGGTEGLSGTPGGRGLRTRGRSDAHFGRRRPDANWPVA